jgi:hypothetical protein
MSEKPLHVRVAEALGCKPYWHEGHGWWLCECGDLGHVQESEKFADGLAGAPLLNRYDQDWSATGPLIEKYRITLTDDAGGGYEGDWFALGGFEMLASCDGEAEWDHTGPGTTPLIAVCNLVLALSEAGKLEKVA